MHELSIAMEIVHIAEKEAQKAKVQSFTLAELEIGTLSGVEAYSLESAWPMAIVGTVLENAKLKIETINARAKCTECSHEFDISHQYDVCPQCGSYFKEVLKGKEMRVKSFEI